MPGMAGFKDSHLLADGVDYTQSHRTPPAVPSVAYNSTAAGAAPLLSDLPGRPQPDPRQFNLQNLPQTVIHRVPTAGGADDERRPPSSRRRGSLSGIFRRNSSNITGQPIDDDVPPLPVTRIAQVEEAARQRTLSAGSTTSHTAPSASHNSTTAPRSATNPALSHPTTAASASPPTERNHLRKASGDSRKGRGMMLRKSSKVRQQQALAEQERAAEQERLANRPPPHLPSLNPLPNIASFGGEDARSDYAHHYTTSVGSNPSYHQPRTAANFSRPAAMAPATPYASNANSSSPPTYHARSANALPSSSSSPEVRGAAAAPSNGEYVAVDPYNLSHRPESMANRGRYSYASSTAQVNTVNSPRRVRRRKDPTPFNVLVIGAKKSGKTSFISFLKHSLALKSATHDYLEPQAAAAKSSFTSTYVESELDGERIGLTLWDSVGLEKNIVDLQMREMATFVESKFEDTFLEEQKVSRTPGVKDTHIHCVFLLLDPVRLDAGIASTKKTGIPANTLDDADLQVMRALWGKTTVIPVVSKADTLTVGHMAFLKRAVWQSLKGAKLDPLEALELEDDAGTSDDDDSDEYHDANGNSDSDYDRAPKPRKANHARQSSLTANGTAAEDDTPYLPMSVLSPDLYDLPPYAKPSSKKARIGRRYPWGFADPLDAEHCDFGRLRDSIFSEWRAELRELSRARWYENWRTSRLKNLPGAKSRVKGGVTPVGSVPREGRRGVSSSGGQMAVPRSVSGGAMAEGGAQQAPVGMAVTTQQPQQRLTSVNEQQQRHVPGSYGSAESFE